MSFASLLLLPWPSFVFIFAAILTAPIYFLLVLALLKARRRQTRFRTTYYNLVLTQALADFYSMSSDFFTYIFRYAGFWRDFYWENRHIIAPYSFNSNHFDLMLRVFGECLVSLQRYLVLCHPTARIQEAISHLPFLIVALMHWIPPLMISLPITLNFNRTFDKPESLLTVIDQRDQMLASCLEVCYQSVMFCVSVTAYLLVFRAILKNKAVRGLTREMRLSLVVMGQSMAFTLSLIFFITQFVVVLQGNQAAAIKLREFYPLLIGFESCINPWLQLFLNSDLRYQVLVLFGCSKSAIVSTTWRRSDDFQAPATESDENEAGRK